jgi:hypothetical protein
MTIDHRVSRTDLARNTRRVLLDVQRGRTALIESHGEPEAALMDIVDYRLLRAVVRYHAELPAILPDAGLSDEVVAACKAIEDAYGLVLAHYLASAISLGRAGELLDIPWLELRTRFLRLDIPVRSAPEDRAEEERDVAITESL